MARALQVALVGLALLLAGVSAARELQSTRLSKTENECPGFGDVGRCEPLCSFIEDRVINGFDESVTFTMNLLELGVRSGDSIYTSCDPVSGDVADSTTAAILTSVQDVPLHALPPPSNTTCPDYPRAGQCNKICDYIVSMERAGDADEEADAADAADAAGDEDEEEDLSEGPVEFFVNLKELGVTSAANDLTVCDPHSGFVVDIDRRRKRLASVRRIARGAGL